MGQAGGAEVAFVGGPVATKDAAETVTDAVAVHDGRISTLGRAAHDCITSRTEIIDLGGRLLLPGFHDAHAHPLYGGFQQLRCDLTGSADAAQCLRRIGDYAREQNHGWIVGGGWESGWFPSGLPSRHALDAVTGSRPAMLVNADQHDAWVNSAALRIAGIDRDTPDPVDGWIARADDGTPAGSLHEGAVDLVSRVVAKGTARDYREALLLGQRHLQRYGVTSWHDAIVGPYLGYADTLPTYVELDDAGLLTGHVRGALWWDRHRGTEQIDELLDRRDRARGRRFRAETVKIMVDGVCENFSAALTAPYRNGRGHGTRFVQADQLAEAVTVLDAAGFQLHFHAVGDRAISNALDAVAVARSTNGDNDLRHQIAHVQVVHPADIPRFRALGVAATIQPRWAVNDAQMTELTTPYLGQQRAQWQYPFRQLRDARVALAAGSDWPVSEADPISGIHVAVNRQDPEDSSTEPLLPNQALDLHSALAAYTRGSAWVGHSDQRSGSIEPGKAADFVVLSENIFEKPRAEIADCVVEMTVVDGRVVHSR